MCDDQIISFTTFSLLINRGKLDEPFPYDHRASASVWQNCSLQLSLYCSRLWSTRKIIQTNLLIANMTMQFISASFEIVISKCYVLYWGLSLLDFILVSLDNSPGKKTFSLNIVIQYLYDYSDLIVNFAMP